MADAAADNSRESVVSAIYSIPRRPVSSHFIENISPVTPVSGPSNPEPVSPLEEELPPLPQQIALEVPREGQRPPSYRSAGSTGFTAPYHDAGSNDEQYRFEKPRPKRESRRNWMTRRINDLDSTPKAGWRVMGILSILLSLLSVTVIILVLHKYDGKPLSEWPHSIHLNSFLALFTTLAQAGLIVPISEGLVLLKYIWSAEQDRPLPDSRKFDEASRGPIGSLKLLWRLKGRQLASIGASISILALALSPMTQQILSYPSYPTPTISSSPALAPRSEGFNSYNTISGGVGVPEMKMQQAIKSAILNPTNESIVAIAPTCPSGSCSWLPFSSLSICTKVANVSSFLTITPIARNVSAPAEYNVLLPNGAYMQAGEPTMNISTPLALVNGKGVEISNHSLAFKNESNIVFTAINNYFVIFESPSDQTGQPSFGAIEVLTYWCVNTYNVSVVNGVTTTIVNSSSTNVVSESAKVVNGTSQEYGEMVLTAEGSAENSTKNYTVDGKADQVLANYMAKTFSGYCSTEPGEEWSTDAAMALSAVLSQADGLQLEGVQKMMANLAVSMTNSIRTFSSPGNTVAGTMYSSVPRIRVSWGWLSFMIVLIVCSTMFLLATIWKLRRADIGRPWSVLGEERDHQALFVDGVGDAGGIVDDDRNTRRRGKTALVKIKLWRSHGEGVVDETQGSRRSAGYQGE